MIPKRNREKIKELGDSVLEERQYRKDKRLELENFVRPYITNVQSLMRTEHDIGCLVEIRQTMMVRGLEDEILFEEIVDVIQEAGQTLSRVNGWLDNDTAERFDEMCELYGISRSRYKNAENELERYVSKYKERRNLYNDEALCREFISLLPPSVAQYIEFNKLEGILEKQQNP